MIIPCEVTKQIFSLVIYVLILANALHLYKYGIVLSATENIFLIFAISLFSIHKYVEQQVTEQRDFNISLYLFIVFVDTLVVMTVGYFCGHGFFGDIISLRSAVIFGVIMSLIMTVVQYKRITKQRKEYCNNNLTA